MRGEMSAIFGGKKVELRQTVKAVTRFGGRVVFLEFLRKVGFAEKVSGAMRFEWKSANAIPAVETFTAFVISVGVGARRFAQAGRVKADKARQGVLGLKRFPTDDTIRNLFKRFNQAVVYRFYPERWDGQLRRLEPRNGGWSLDLDSTVFERYGRQPGALKGPNPRKHGRPSHHPLLAVVLAEAQFVAWMVTQRPLQFSAGCGGAGVVRAGARDWGSAG